MATTRITAEQAKQCPKCHNIGEVVSSKGVVYKGSPGQLIVVECRFKLCPWYMTRWVIQVDDDNMVLVRDSGHELKSYPHMVNPMSQEAVMAKLDKEAKEIELG